MNQLHISKQQAEVKGIQITIEPHTHKLHGGYFQCRVIWWLGQSNFDRSMSARLAVCNTTNTKTVEEILANIVVTQHIDRLIRDRYKKATLTHFDITLLTKATCNLCDWTVTHTGNFFYEADSWAITHYEEAHK